MKKLFKCMASAMVMALALGSFSTNTVNAYEISTQDTQGHGFEKKWDALWCFEINYMEGSMKIGYDTWWTNEDYVKNFYMTGYKHYAKVTNSNGTSDSTDISKGSYGTPKADIKHTGVPVTYTAVYWEA